MKVVEECAGGVAAPPIVIHLRILEGLLQYLYIRIGFLLQILRRRDYGGVCGHERAPYP
jgi:hypothetical protein